MILFFRLFLLLSLSAAVPAYAQTPDAAAIIKKIEDNLNGKSAIMELSMTVSTARGERTMKMESYSVGNKKSFIKITYPGKDAGITFLKVDNTMWQYVPRIEKIIKIPASMMLQSWMGSDFTNDDLVRESSLSEDYRTRILEEREDGYVLELIPLEDAPVVWGKILMEVSGQYYLPTEVRYFDEDDVLVRILNYSEVKKLDDRYYPTRWIMVPQDEDKKDHKTEMSIGRAKFDVDVDPDYFTKRALKRFSH